MKEKRHSDKINDEQEDEMLIYGYYRSYTKTFFTGILVLASFGLLFLLMTWKRSINMRLTHVRCSLEEAKKIFLVDSNKQQYLESVIHDPERDCHSRSSIYFYNKKVKYIWDPQQNKFSKVEGLKINSCADFHDMEGGQSTVDASLRLQLYGRNFIFIKVEPVFKLILREIRNPFYTYQICFITVWLVGEYYNFSICILSLSMISIAFTVWQTRKQTRALRDAVHTDAIITVLRDGKEVQKPSEELVPGDVIIIPQTQFTMVCDAVLLNGNCLVNESMLTGESTLITKTPIANDPALYSVDIHKRSTLFCGTQIVHTRSAYDDTSVKAVVYRTGFATSKGELVRAILYPKPTQLKLHNELHKYIIFLLSLGIVPLIYTSVVFTQLQASTFQTILYIVMVVTFMVPPALPAVLTCVNALAQRRLRKQGIFCLNSRYVSACGILDVVCFDKTGTLTEDSLDLFKVVPIEDGKFSDAVTELQHLERGPLVEVMGTCHSLRKVDGMLLGNTLDAKLFEAVGWDLVEPLTAGKFEKIPSRLAFPKKFLKPNEIASSVAIVREFPFESALRCMSVITRTEGNDHFDVYLKGAPELVSSLSLKDTVPDNFSEVLGIQTQQGFRVLGVGWKPLPSNITWEQVAKLKREEVECDLHFEGLFILQNQLKPETVPVLNTLKDSEVRIVMVTGDNLQTAVTVSRNCGIIEECDTVFIVEAEVFVTPSGQQKLRVLYNNVRNPEINKNVDIRQNGDGDEIHLLLPHHGRYHLAVEGETFNLIQLYEDDLLDKVVLKGSIFARMLPKHKLYLIEALQKLGYQVGMCGDGANDCGALRTANVGVSLSVEEASVASPFTASKQNIECIPTVIREGRATLTAVFGVLKYMLFYSLGFLIAVLFLFWDGQVIGDGDYVLIDFAINLIPPFAFGYTEAYPHLSVRRPTRSFLSFLPQFSLISYILIQTGLLTFVRKYSRMQPWYDPSYSIMTILTINAMSYIIAAVIFSPGPPYRKNLFSNKLFTSILIIQFLFISALTIYPPDFLLEYLKFRRAPLAFHLTLYGFSMANFVVSYIWEVVFVQGVLFGSVVPFLKKLRGPIHKYEKLQAHILEKKEWLPVGKHEYSI